ncbi:MAG: helix-turn-helix domain-containing protein [Ruminococcaceae bacterium]|nr:helix-turn-helix domain-containing protein [Oscillospiraceae bacterium]
MELSEKITYLRKRKGWSQEQLAGKLEVSRQAVYKWEAGISQPEIDKLKKISKLFEISFNELLDDELDITIISDTPVADAPFVDDKGQADTMAVVNVPDKAETILINEENENSENQPTSESDIIEQSVDAEAEKAVQDEIGCEKNVGCEIRDNRVDNINEEKELTKNDNSVKSGKRALLIGIIASVALTLALSVTLLVLITYYLNNVDFGPSTGTSGSQASSTPDTGVSGTGGSDTKESGNDNPTSGSDAEQGGNDSTASSSGNTDSSQDNNQSPDITDGTYYTVSFVADGVPSVGNVQIKEGGFVTVPKVEREGYILLGWVDMETFEEWSFAENAVTKSITLYAVWMKDNTITVTFDKNDGSGTTESVRIDPRDQLVLGDMFTDSEKTALGWAIKPGGAVEYKAYEKAFFEESITLYAVWAPKNTVSITFDTNNKSSEKYKVYITKGGSYTLTTPYDEKGLIGWSKSPQGQRNYGIGQTVTFDKNTTLYAIWSNNDGLYFTSRGNGTCVLEKYTGNDTSLVIPEYYNGDRVTEIRDFAFSNLELYNDTLKSLQLPSGITTIGENTLYGLRGLEMLKIPAGVNSISTKAFLSFGCIREFWVDDNNARYCHIEGALYNKERTNLIKYPIGSYTDAYRVPEGTNIIEENAFFGSIYLKEVYFPDSVGVVRKSAFEFCVELTTINFGGSLNYVEARAFYDCYSLKQVTFEHDIIDIGNMAFCNCRSLTYVEFRGDVNVISYRSFANCTELTTVRLYGRVTDRIDSSAFEGCENVEITEYPVP